MGRLPGCPGLDFQAGRQVLRHTQQAVCVAAAGQQQHHLAGQRGFGQRVGHADVFGNLDARHRRDLAFWQQVAVANANQLLLRLERWARQLAVERVVSSQPVVNAVKTLFPDFYYSVGEGIKGGLDSFGAPQSNRPGDAFWEFQHQGSLSEPGDSGGGYYGGGYADRYHGQRHHQRFVRGRYSERARR